MSVVSLVAIGLHTLRGDRVGLRMIPDAGHLPWLDDPVGVGVLTATSHGSAAARRSAGVGEDVR